MLTNRMFGQKSVYIIRFSLTYVRAYNALFCHYKFACRSTASRPVPSAMFGEKTHGYHSNPFRGEIIIFCVGKHNKVVNTFLVMDSSLQSYKVFPIMQSVYFIGGKIYFP